MTIDLRSDTFTKPGPEMLNAMMNAKVGDDVFGEDETVIALEEKAAKLFGHEAALYCTSGTMSNQIGIKVHTRPADEVICDKLAHVYNYEGGGIAFHSGASVRLLDGDLGRFTREQVAENINKDDVHLPRTSLVCLENTCNRGGGSIWDMNEIKSIRQLCKEKGLKMHLDGARIFNAVVATNSTAAEHGAQFDSISICLSKGLGCPIGSILTGTKDFIHEARRIRKMFGGGMRQAGFIAAAGLYALEHNIDRLADDHRRAKQIASVLEKTSYVERVLPTETNVLVFEVADTALIPKIIKALSDKGIKVAQFGKKGIRMVTHLDVSQEMADRVCEVVRDLKI